MKYNTESLFKTTVNGYNRKQVNEYIRQLMNEMEIINQKCQKEIMNFKVQNKELKNVFQFRLEEKDKVINHQSQKIEEVVQQLDELAQNKTNQEGISNEEYTEKLTQLQEHYEKKLKEYVDKLDHSEVTKNKLNQELLSKSKELELLTYNGSGLNDYSKKELRSKELEIEKLQQRMENKQKSINELANEKTILENEIVKRNEEVQYFKVKMDELNEIIENKNEETLNYKEMKEQLKEENELRANEIADLKEIIIGKDNEIEELSKNTEELIKICNALKDRANEYETNKDKITNALISAQEKADTIVEEAKIESTILKSKIQVEIDKKNQELKAVESEVHSLQENIVEVLERYQFLLKDIKGDDTKVSKVVKM